MSYKDNNQSDVQNGGVGYQPKINEVARDFIEDLQKERSRLSDDFPLCAFLINEAIDRIYSTGRIPGREVYADVLKQRPMKLTQKVFVPVKQYPKFNFIGKILGPKGNSLIRLQDEVQCKILIKGRGSVRDKDKEEELRKLGDPRYNHLNKDLFLEISTVATPAEGYARIAYALAEIRKYLIPDKNDEVSQEQLREIMKLDPELAKTGFGVKPEIFKSVFDKLVGSKGSSKYSGLLKYTTHAECEDIKKEIKEEHEYITPFSSPSQHRSKTIVYEYLKGHKRSAVPVYETAKRVREAPTTKTNKNVKTPIYDILKRYKLNK